MLLVDGMDPTDSEPVYLYVAGMLHHYSKVIVNNRVLRKIKIAVKSDVKNRVYISLT